MNPTNDEILSHIKIHTDKDDDADVELSEDGKSATLIFANMRQDFDITDIDREQSSRLIASAIWDKLSFPLEIMARHHRRRHE